MCHCEGAAQCRQTPLQVALLRGVATPSNCGEFLKLLHTKPSAKAGGGRGNDPGYGKSGSR
jgi:hypothetical protein